jgi:uncharacterized membrane protein YfcA
MESAVFAISVIMACFVQAVAGFGLPMIAMPVLVSLLGIKTAVPLTAIIILELQLLMIVRYRMALNLTMVMRISAAAVLGIPIGVLFLSRIPEGIMVTLLGLLLIFYAFYAFFKFPVPALKNPYWAYIFGFLGGMGGGAYNMASPPMIIYGDTQRWGPELFKANLQGYFLIIGLVAILTHALSGNVSGDILRRSLIAVPLVVIGAAGGFFLDRFIDAVIFRKIVLGLMLVLGISLVVNSL